MYPVLARARHHPSSRRTVVADVLYRRAGLGPQDIDVAQLYDCFTITVLLQLEDWGFCAKGEGGPFVDSGAIDLGGSLPINTGGGHLSEGYIHGLNHVVEGVRQIRGTSTSQVAGAETCLVTSTPLPAGQRPDPEEAMTTTAAAPRLLPVDDDLDTGGFFDAARRGELAIRRCNGCDAVLHVPRAYCRHCGSWEGRWEVVDGAAHAVLVDRRGAPGAPGLPGALHLVLVDLDDLPGRASSATCPVNTTSPPACRSRCGSTSSARSTGDAWWSRSGDRSSRTTVVRCDEQSSRMRADCSSSPASTCVAPPTSTF